MSNMTLDFFWETVLPRLLTMTLISFVIGSAVGAMVGAVATWLRRRFQRDKASASSRPQHRLVPAAMLGSFIGMLLIGMLPIQANPASLIGGPYSGLWFLMMFILLAPTGAVVGAVLGIILEAKLPARLDRSGLAGIVLLVSYVISTVALHVGLAAPPVVMRTPQTSEPLPVIAEIKGYEGSPKAMALSADGQRLAISTVRYSTERTDIWDVPSRRVVLTLKGLGGSATLKDILSSLNFAENGEIITAAVREVQVREPVSGNVKLRLEGGEIGYPMAGNRLVTLAVVDPWSAPPGTPYTLKVWDTTNGKLLQTIPVDLDPTTTLPLAVSPDRRLLAVPPSLWSNQIQVWDITTGKQVKSLALKKEAGILALSFSSDGQQLAVSLGQGAPLSIWDWQGAKVVKTIPDVVMAKQLYWTDRGIWVVNEDGLKLHDPQTGKVKQSLNLKSPGDPSLPWLGPTAFSADRNTLAAYVDSQQSIKLWRLSSSPE